MTVQELIEATAGGKLEPLLDAHRNELTTDLARELCEVFKQAVSAGDHALAQVSAIAACISWLYLGDRRESLVNLIDWKQLEFAMAEAPAQYAKVRADLLKACDLGKEIGARDEAFKAATIPADCSFWAARASEPPARDDLRLQTLRDVIATCELAEANAGGDFERFVSLTAATADEAMSAYWGEREPEAKDLLRQLAVAADRAIPVSFTFAQVGDTAKTAATAQVLATLADEYID